MGVGGEGIRGGIDENTFYFNLGISILSYFLNKWHDFVYLFRRIAPTTRVFYNSFRKSLKTH